MKRGAVLAFIAICLLSLAISAYAFTPQCVYPSTSRSACPLLEEQCGDADKCGKEYTEPAAYYDFEQGKNVLDTFKATASIIEFERTGPFIPENFISAPLKQKVGSGNSDPYIELASFYEDRKCEPGSVIGRECIDDDFCTIIGDEVPACRDESDPLTCEICRTLDCRCFLESCDLYDGFYQAKSDSYDLWDPANHYHCKEPYDCDPSNPTMPKAVDLGALSWWYKLNIVWFPVTKDNAGDVKIGTEDKVKYNFYLISASSSTTAKTALIKKRLIQNIDPWNPPSINPVFAYVAPEATTSLSVKISTNPGFASPNEKVAINKLLDRLQAKIAVPIDLPGLCQYKKKGKPQTFKHEGVVYKDFKDFDAKINLYVKDEKAVWLYAECKYFDPNTNNYQTQQTEIRLENCEEAWRVFSVLTSEPINQIKTKDSKTPPGGLQSMKTGYGEVVYEWQKDGNIEGSYWSRLEYYSTNNMNAGNTAKLGACKCSGAFER